MKLRKLSKVTQLVKGTFKIQSQVLYGVLNGPAGLIWHKILGKGLILKGLKESEIRQERYTDPPQDTLRTDLQPLGCPKSFDSFVNSSGLSSVFPFFL